MPGWWDNRLRYMETYADWFRTPGGRALHAFYDGADVPICGVRPMGLDGQPIPWRRHTGGRRRPHGLCERLARKEKDRRLQALIERQREEMAR